MRISYLRVSTSDQTLASQRLAIETALGEAPEREFVDEGISGRVMQREGLDACLNALRADDELVVYSLSRLGRSWPPTRTPPDGGGGDRRTDARAAGAAEGGGGMSMLLFVAAIVLSLLVLTLAVIGAIAVRRWWRERTTRHSQRIENLAFCIEPEYLDAHAPGWREGACTVRSVKRAQRESLRMRPAWTLELAC